MSQGAVGHGDEVSVRFFATIRDTFGAKELKVPAAQAGSVRDLLIGICDDPARHRAVLDGDGEFRGDLTLLVNGRHVQFAGGMEAELHGGDVVSIFPPLYGG